MYDKMIVWDTNKMIIVWTLLHKLQEVQTLHDVRFRLRYVF